MFNKYRLMLEEYPNYSNYKMYEHKGSNTEKQTKTVYDEENYP